MPSGAKKRKAAKKKKGTQPTNNPNSSSLASTQGGGDVKHQDDRQSDVGQSDVGQSDVGDASSTTSQDHPSHHDLLTEGEEETSGNQADSVRTNGDDKHEVEVERNDVQAEREFKIEDEVSGKFEHEENERKSYDGGPSGSSSSSNSDDESHGVKSHASVDKAPASAEIDHSLQKDNVEVVPPITIGEASEAVVDTIPPVISDKVTLLSETAEDGEKKGSVEESTIPPVEKVPETSDPKICAMEETDERLSLSYNAPTATHDNGADAEKDSGVTQPLLVPHPRPQQTTSWKGCCGLFELFTGSDR